MKGYFIFLVTVMVGFTGFILFKRPGSFNNESLSKLFDDPSKLKYQTEQSNYPYFSYVSGDALLHTQAESYLVVPNTSFRLGDELSVSPSSFVHIKLGPQQILKIIGKSKITFTHWPTRHKGFYGIRLLQGTLLVDHYPPEGPIGVKVEIGQNYFFGQDTSFSAQYMKEAGNISVLRGQLHYKSAGQTLQINKDEGINLIDGQPLAHEAHSFIRNHQWPKFLKELFKHGVDEEPTLKATSLKERPAAVDLIERKMANFNNEKEDKKPRETQSPNPIQKTIQSIGQKVRAVNEATETIQNYEEIQKQKVDRLDNIED